MRMRDACAALGGTGSQIRAQAAARVTGGITVAGGPSEPGGLR